MNKNIMGADQKRQIKHYMIFLAVISFVLFILYYGGKCKTYNTTILAFSYKYGLISRGFIGSVYAVINKLLPINMYDYLMALRFTQVVTALFFLFILFFAYQMLRQCKKEMMRKMVYMLLVLVIILVPNFSAEWNFGRVDLYMLGISMVSALFIMYERCEWLIPPMCAIGVMIHQGYVLMFFNIILILLFYRMMTTEGSKRKKYFWLLATSFIIGSAMFLYLQLFSHANGAEIYPEIAAKASALTDGGKYHTGLVDAEILGVDLTESERELHMANLVETPIYLVIIMPLIILLFQFFRGLIKRAESGAEKFTYLMLMIGAVTILPDFLKKVDYGRWFFSMACYYLICIIVLYAMGDCHIKEQLCESAGLFRKKPYILLFLIYILILMPFEDVHICLLMEKIGNYLNTTYLHLWNFQL